MSIQNILKSLFFLNILFVFSLQSHVRANDENSFLPDENISDSEDSQELQDVEWKKAKPKLSLGQKFGKVRRGIAKGVGKGVALSSGSDLSGEWVEEALSYKSDNRSRLMGGHRKNYKDEQLRQKVRQDMSEDERIRVSDYYKQAGKNVGRVVGREVGRVAATTATGVTLGLAADAASYGLTTPVTAAARIASGMGGAIVGDVAGGAIGKKVGHGMSKAALSSHKSGYRGKKMGSETALRKTAKARSFLSKTTGQVHSKLGRAVDRKSENLTRFAGGMLGKRTENTLMVPYKDADLQKMKLHEDNQKIHNKALHNMQRKALRERKDTRKKKQRQALGLPEKQSFFQRAKGKLSQYAPQNKNRGNYRKDDSPLEISPAD